MRFLRLADYKKQIKTDNLLQIVEEDYTILLDVEQAAQSEMIGYLNQRYDTSLVFTDTQEFNIGSIYSTGNLVEYTAPNFSTATTYSTDDRVVYNNSIYKSVSGSTGVSPNTGTTSWTYITQDKSLYNAITGSTGVYPEDTNYFAKGDNRNPLIVQFLIDIVLYHLHCRISPRQIPDHRITRFDGGNSFQSGGAIGWLKRVASGDVSVEIPKLSPSTGASIMWGSNLKNNNIL